VVLGLPADDGIVVTLLEQHPLLTSSGRAPSHQREPAPELFAAHCEMDVATLDLDQRVVAARQAPRAPVPHDHVAAAVLTGDDAFEVEVVEWVVLDVHRQAAHARVERRAFRHRPADQHSAGFEPQVIVQVAGPVSLHDEPPPVALRRCRTLRLGGDREVALRPITLQPISHLTITHPACRSPTPMQRRRT
jgi:hypothetical protein